MQQTIEADALTAMIATMRASLDVLEQAVMGRRAAEPAEAITPNTRLVISQEEVCEELGITRMTLWRRRKQGRFIKPIDVGSKTIMFRYADFTAWVASGGPNS